MGDMRERLAKELCRRFSAYSDGRDWEEFLEDVPALLAILREPDEEMVDNGRHGIGGEPDSNADTPEAARDCWQAMIDTIARPTSPSNTPA